MRFIIPKQSVDLKKGEKVPFPLKEAVEGKSTTVHLSTATKNHCPRITIIATRSDKEGKIEGTLELPTLVDQPEKKQILYSPELMVDENNEFDTISIIADEDIQVGFAVTYEGGSGVINSI